MPPAPARRKAFPVSTVAAAVLLCCVTAIAYLLALHNGFIWDDDRLVTGNNLLKSASGLHKIWFTTEPSDYWPVTLTAFWVQWRLWGLNATGYHAVNIALHITEALFLWALLRRLQIPGAFLGAFLFAVHPVNVESVAWISELKNLTAMLFFLATVWCFLNTEIVSPVRRSPREGGSVHQWYALSLLSFILGMLSKGSIAILPLILLGIIRWHRPINRRDLARLAPFFVVSAVLVAVDVWFQKHGTAEVIRTAGFLDRLLGAGAVIWFYLGKALWPVNLMFVYPGWHIRAADPLWWIPLLAAVGVTVALWRSRRPWSRPVLFAWGFFCVSLVPVMGFADVYFMRYSLVADHYQHIAIIGFVGLVAAGFGKMELGKWKVGTHIVAAVVIGILACLTWRQCENYRDSKTLYRGTLEKNPDAWNIHTNLGLILFGESRVWEAIAQYRSALRIKPDSMEANNDLGVALAEVGRPDESRVYLEKALLLKPDSIEAQYNMGLACVAVRRYPEAIVHLEQVQRLRPDFNLTDFNLGIALAGAGRPREAVPRYERTLRLRHDFPEAQNGLGDALAQMGRLREAVTYYQTAVRLRPNYAEAHDGLGRTLAKLGRISEARSEFEKALKLKPDDAEAKTDLARLGLP